MDKIIEQVKEYGIELIIDKNFKLNGPVLKVECDLDIVVGLDWINDCILKKITKRGTEFFCSFKQAENKLTINFFTKCDQQYFNYFDVDNQVKIATTFVDLCWIYSEGTTNTSIDEAATEFRKEDNIKTGDLTWILPSKFVDDFVEMVHTINPDFMSGLMQDVIVYGPYYMDNY